MSKISIVMPTYNAEKYVSEAIESTLKQSFSDFEFIIIDDGSTDGTREIISSYDDDRIRLVENEHNFVGSLNKGLKLAKGKYIARMDADDIMHIDRLKIQHTIMEAKPEIDICSAWMIPFGDNMPKGSVSRSLSGLIDAPLLQLLQACIFFHPTIMMRTCFVRQNQMKYDKDYVYAEDYKLWVEVAKCGGKFYIEAQPLLYYRVSENQISNVKHIEQRNISTRIKKEILEYLFNLNSDMYSILPKLEENLWILHQQNLVTESDVFGFFHSLFSKNRKNLNLRCKF